MKEVTYEEWQKNSTPREMWVWDEDEEDKKKLKVIYISKEAYPVISISVDDKHSEHYMYCAEIEKQRRMTNKELSRWLREKSTREYKYKKSGYILCSTDYTKENCNDEVEDILIREDDGEWREPLVEVEE